MSIKVTQDYFFSSEEVNGAKYKTPGGDEFAVEFEYGAFEIPADAEEVEVSVPRATIVYNTPNITLGVNSSFIVTAQHPLSGGPITVDVDLPTGIYTAGSVNDELFKAYNAASIADNPLFDWTNVAPPPFQVTVNLILLRFEITLNAATTRLDFRTVGNALSLGDFLGFGHTLLDFPPSAPFVYTAPDAAKVNSVNSYLIHCDLVQGGLLINGKSSQCVAQVPINVEQHGRVINYESNIPPTTQAPHLPGTSSRVVRLWLTDERNQPVDTGGEPWGFQLRTTYFVEHKSKRQKI